MNCSSNVAVYEEAVGRAGSWARPCEGCSVLPSVVYCHADSAYLCASCDVWIHTANRLASRHERVLLSEAYRHAPAVQECRAADAAALCAAYEAHAHYAYQLAVMHQCVPVVSHPAAAIPAASVLPEAAATTTTAMLGCKQEEAPWLLHGQNSANHNCSSTYFGEVDEYFDLAGYNNSCYGDDSHMSNHHHRSAAQYVMQEEQLLQQMQKEYAEKEGSECMVPSQFSTVSKPQQSGYALVGAEQPSSVAAGVSAVYTAGTINNSTSFSRMEAGIVPENTVIDLTHSSILAPAGASSAFPGPALEMPPYFSSMDRESRLLRYKEKKKTRNFEKTTRYTKRKEYAEARPRIKGRFAKKSEEEMELDEIFSTAALSEGSYSTVPWF